MNNQSKPTFGGLAELTPERRKEIHEARNAKVAQWGELGLRQDFFDDRFMRECAKLAGIRTLPVAVEPPTKKRVMQLCRKSGIAKSQGQLYELTGCSVEHFIALNPRWPLWALLCSIAEMYCVASNLLIPSGDVFAVQ